MVARLLAACLLFQTAAAFATPGLNAAPATAVGTFTSQGVTLRMQSAVAFRGKASVGGGDALIVVVATARMNAVAIADYVDRRRVIEKRVRDGEMGIVYFELAPDGRYLGMSYQLGPGNGCAPCSAEVASTARVVGDWLGGDLVGTGADRSFDLTLVAPVLSDDHGVPLPADGGAPGRAYAAYHEALSRTDRAALKPVLSQDQRAVVEVLEKDGKADAHVQALATAHPGRSLRVTGGYANGDKAVLLIAGESSAGPVTGEVLLIREAGHWRVDDEITERGAR
jgi:hypothetical protein